MVADGAVQQVIGVADQGDLDLQQELGGVSDFCQAPKA